jgi:hypothetical protein
MFVREGFGQAICELARLSTLKANDVADPQIKHIANKLAELHAQYPNTTEYALNALDWTLTAFNLGATSVALVSSFYIGGASAAGKVALDIGLSEIKFRLKQELISQLSASSEIPLDKVLAAKANMMFLLALMEKSPKLIVKASKTIKELPAKLKQLKMDIKQHGQDLKSALNNLNQQLFADQVATINGAPSHSQHTSSHDNVMHAKAQKDAALNSENIKKSQKVTYAAWEKKLDKPNPTNPNVNIKNARPVSHGYKHHKAKSEHEAKVISSNGEKPPAQYLPKINVQELEKRAIAEGKECQKGSVVYYFYKSDTIVGYDEGKPTLQSAVDLTFFR